MTLKAWGHAHVSSALEVYTLLQTRPGEPAERRLWLDLLELEPPFWGSLMQYAASIANLNARGYRVWSWDDHGAVLSPSSLEPPTGLHYRTWAHLLHEHDEPPTHPRPYGTRAPSEPSHTSTWRHDDMSATSPRRS